MARLRGRARPELLHHEHDEIRILLDQGPETLLIKQREFAGAGGPRGRQPRAYIEQRQGAERLALVDRADDPRTEAMQVAEGWGQATRHVVSPSCRRGHPARRLGEEIDEPAVPQLVAR
jgi:hypothetical protein